MTAPLLPLPAPGIENFPILALIVVQLPHSYGGGPGMPFDHLIAECRIPRSLWSPRLTL